jgi:hypothetical protein
LVDKVRRVTPSTPKVEKTGGSALHEVVGAGKETVKSYASFLGQDESAFPLK